METNDFEDILSKQLSEEIKAEIDTELFKTIYSGSGFLIPDIRLTEDAKEWCRENLKGDYHIFYDYVAILEESDYNWFILRWGDT